MNSDLASQLAAEKFLSGLPRPQLARLATSARLVEFSGGHRLFGEGERADRFWLLRQGRAAIDLHVPGRGRVLIETLGPGEVLGWSWLFPPHEWIFGATVVEGPLRAFEFDARHVRTVCALDTVLGRELHGRFTGVLLDRLQATRLRLVDLYGLPGGPS